IANFGVLDDAHALSTHDCTADSHDLRSKRSQLGIESLVLSGQLGTWRDLLAYKNINCAVVRLEPDGQPTGNTHRCTGGMFWSARTVVKETRQINHFPGNGPGQPGLGRTRIRAYSYSSQSPPSQNCESQTN